MKLGLARWSRAGIVGVRILEAGPLRDHRKIIEDVSRADLAGSRRMSNLRSDGLGRAIFISVGSAHDSVPIIGRSRFDT